MLKLIATDHKYSENNGAWNEYHCWNGSEVVVIGGMYDHQDNDRERITGDATETELELARAWILANTEERPTYNKYCYNMRGAYTYLYCVVTLARSRKAPNKTPLKVVEFFESYYDRKFNQQVAEKITVTDGSTSWTVSSNCIDQLVKGTKKLPFWY
jgi:hypothetical protein